MRKSGKIFLLSWLLLMPLLQSCTIDEDPWPGSLTVTAITDTDEADPGAEIILDGRGTPYHTPHTITDLEPGEHSVALVAASFSMADTTAYTVYLDNDYSHANVEILMLHNRGILNISPMNAAGDPVTARVIIDLSSSYSPAPCLLSVPTGQHLVHLAADGYTVTPESLVVDVIHNEEQELEFLMTPAVGDSYQVEINATDEEGSPVAGLAVWLDGLPYGYVTPAQFTVGPDDVEHLLELRIGYSIRAEHLVLAGQQESLLWEPVVSEIKLEVMSTPTGMPIYIDEQVTGFVTPYEMSLTGSHFVSVAGDGYATPLPGGWQLDIANDTQIEITLENGTDGVHVGEVATDFTLPLYGADPGENMTLHQFRGRVVLLNFWFVDCPNCIEELPGLNTVYNEFRSEGFRFLTVDEWGNADIDNLDQFFADNPEYQFPVMLDQNGSVTTLYGLSSAPWNLLIDKTGVIRYREQGLEEDQLRGWVEELISE